MIYAAIGIPIVLVGFTTVVLVVATPCTHEMFPQLHAGTGRTFHSCRCGKRFQVMTKLPPVGPDLYAANRRVLAERLNWPDGALDECERIDADHPGWLTSYRHESPSGPAGWYSRLAGHRRSRYLYGATPDELREAITGPRYTR